MKLGATPDSFAHGQQLEAGVLVRTVKLHHGKRPDVFWGVVKEV